MISINIDKAKQIGHNIRRELRSKEFEPLDMQISKQIPGIDVNSIEAQRQSIRNKYAVMQENINSAFTAEEIKQAIGLD